ncbi:MAG: hypothetical protein WDA75_20350 [Candidatus Latescibacterota bacterium]|jgi:hypothetical protein
MDIEILTAADGGFYIRPRNASAAVRWTREDNSWVSARAIVPSGSRTVDLAAVPADLREEILAFVARAEVVGEALWHGGD